VVTRFQHRRLEPRTVRVDEIRLLVVLGVTGQHETRLAVREFENDTVLVASFVLEIRAPGTEHVDGGLTEGDGIALSRFVSASRHLVPSTASRYSPYVSVLAASPGS